MNVRNFKYIGREQKLTINLEDMQALLRSMKEATTVHKNLNYTIKMEYRS